MVRIYGLLTPNVLKVVLTAEELSIHYQHINVDLTKKENRSEEHLCRHPFGMVPVIEHEGRFLWESNTIARYLANFTENALYPRNAWKRAQIEQWMDYATNHAGRYITGIFFQRCVAGPLFGMPIDEKRVTENEEALSEEMPVLDSHLSSQAYLTGDSLSLADVILFSLASPYRVGQIDLAAYANFAKWFQRMKERPSVQRVIPRLPMPYIG